MKLRARKFGWDPRLGMLEGIEVELELTHSPMESSEPFDESLASAELVDVLDTLPLLVATFDRDGRLLYMNGSGRRLLDWEAGRTRDVDILSDLYSELDAERLLHEALPAATREGSWSGEGELRTKTGNNVPVVQILVSHPPDRARLRAFTLVARPSVAGDGEEARVRQSLLVLSLGFIHDLNNLLFPINAYASLVERHVSEASPAMRYLDQIQRAARRAQALSARLLDRLRARPTAREPVALSELARDAVEDIAAEFPGHRVSLVTPCSPREILGDAVALQEMVTNLCRNAAESLPREGGNVRVGVSEIEGERTVRFTVSDDGCGIPETDLERIFEPFFTTKVRGTGLGLAVTREIVRLHGGTITVESLPRRGTVIRVDLPVGENGPRVDTPRP
jgi:signal transduction histidine kinase